MLRLKSEDLTPESSLALRPHILVSGHKLKPLAAGALYWEAEKTLLVADLHLEKGAAFAAVGMLLPPYDTRTTLHRLDKVIRDVAPSRVVALGDSFHTSEVAEGLTGDDLEHLTKLQKGCDWYWVSGNHDPRLPRSVGGTICTALTISGITLRHEPWDKVSSREIAGHLHPVARIARRGEMIRRKCFATDGNRLVMPAFGAYTGGLNVLDDAFGPLFLRRQLEAWMMGKSGVYPVLGGSLLPD
jgi:DNA ligase-associated metallophosphoesterase